MNTGILSTGGNYILIAFLYSGDNSKWYSVSNGLYNSTYFTTNGTSFTCTNPCNVTIYADSSARPNANSPSMNFTINGISIYNENSNSGQFSTTRTLNKGDIIQMQIKSTYNHMVLSSFVIQLN